MFSFAGLRQTPALEQNFMLLQTVIYMPAAVEQ
jgi:hypothetical protein